MSTHHSPYGWGAQDLNADRLSRKVPPARKVPLQRGLLIESVDGWVGEVVRAERIGGAIFFGLEDAKGRVKNYPLGTGYLIEGEPVEIIAPAPAKAPKRTISRSGSIAVKNAPARVARASRIWVEGLHDAELVEKVWGHDLRVEGIVVEPLHGVDDLAGAVREFAPGPGRRLGQPHETQADVAQAWKHILSRVDSYADLDPTLLGPVESLIDFLTEPGA